MKSHTFGIRSARRRVTTVAASIAAALIIALNLFLLARTIL